MKCEEIREIINSYIDGELSEIEARRVSQHLSSCSGCAEETRQYKITRDLVSRYGREKAPSDLINNIHINMEKPKTIPIRSALPRRLALVATFAIALLGGAYVGMFHKTPEGILKPSGKYAAKMNLSDQTSRNAGNDGFKQEATGETPETSSIGQEADARNSLSLSLQKSEPNPLSSSHEIGTTSQNPSGGNSANHYDLPVYSTDEESNLSAYGISDAPGTEAPAERIALAPSFREESYSGAEARADLMKAIDQKDKELRGRPAATVEPQYSPESEKTASFSPAPAVAAKPVSLSTFPQEPHENFHYMEIPSGDDVIAYMMSANSAASAKSYDLSEIKPAGISPGAPEGSAKGGAAKAKQKAPKHAAGERKIARATDVFRSGNAAISASECEKIIQSYLKSSGDSSIKARRKGPYIIINGKLSSLISLRSTIRGTLTGKDESDIAKKSEEISASSATSAYNIPLDYPAVLEIYFTSEK